MLCSNPGRFELGCSGSPDIVGKKNEKIPVFAPKPAELLKRIAKGIARQSEEYYALLKSKMANHWGPVLSAFR